MGLRARTSDPQFVGILYLVGVTLVFALGAAAGALLRLELLHGEPWLLSADLFGRLMSAHGVLMLFLFVFPLFPGVLGNLLLPRLLGLSRFALPRVNWAGVLLYLAGAGLVLPAAVQGGIDATWMLRPELGVAGREGGRLLVTGLLVVAVGGVCLHLNLFVTLAGVCRRWRRPTPYFAWSLLGASASWLLAAPIWVALLVLRTMEAVAGIPAFGLAAADPELGRRLFLFFERPALYAAVLPALGLTTELLEQRSSRPCFSPLGVVASFFLLTVLAHLGAVGRFTAAGFSAGDLLSSLAGYLTMVPGFLILGNWMGCLRRLQNRPDPPLLFTCSFLVLALAGGLSGLILGSPGAGIHLHGTLFSVAHLHLLLAGALTAAYLAGLHEWRQKALGMPGAMPWPAVSAGLVLVGSLLAFAPQFILGYEGLPRRMAAYPREFQVWQVLASAGAGLLLAGWLLPLADFGLNLWEGEAGTGDPVPPPARSAVPPGRGTVL